MAKRYVHRAVVEGSGEFPLDMLRYDNCYPATEADAGIAADRHTTGRRKLTVETVTDSKFSRFTAARWDSFLWKVLDEMTVPN